MGFGSRLLQRRVTNLNLSGMEHLRVCVLGCSPSCHIPVLDKLKHVVPCITSFYTGK